MKFVYAIIFLLVVFFGTSKAADTCQEQNQSIVPQQEENMSVLPTKLEEVQYCCIKSPYWLNCECSAPNSAWCPIDCGTPIGG